MPNQMESIFQRFNDAFREQQILINSLANKIEQLEMGQGGGGSAYIEDYAPGKLYKRNTLVVDRITETLYRAACEVEYTSVSIEADRRAGNLKLVGFESQIVTFNHPPTDEEIRQLPEDSLVAIYSSNTKYTSILNTDNVNDG